MDQKKTKERIKFKGFKELCSFFPDGDIEESEEPDFLVRTNQRVFGIEITELHWKCDDLSQSPQANESLRHQYAEDLRQEYDSRDLPPVQAFLKFDSNFVPSDKNKGSLSKHEKKEFVRDLIDLIEENLPRNGEMSFQIDCIKNRNLRKIVNSVIAYLLPVSPQSHFSHSEGAFLPKMSDDDISRALKEKNDKVKSYRKNCDEIWLIICYGFDTLSTEFHKNSSITENLFQSNFDRAFLLHRNELTELKLQAM